jgi:hypothetical protein
MVHKSSFEQAMPDAPWLLKMVCSFPNVRHSTA